MRTCMYCWPRIIDERALISHIEILLCLLKSAIEFVTYLLLTKPQKQEEQPEFVLILGGGK